ncbi:MAG: protein kinase domain-containing protein [Myxococcota bacterium]
MTHPPDEAIVALVEARLPAEAARELRAHLSSCPSCLSLAAELARVVSEVPTLDDDAPSEEAPLDAGAKLGRYIITERAGAGAMGTVYGAFDPVLGRKVALKVLHHSRADQQQRLLREARTLAQLQHPNVSAVFDAGESGGHPFLAMEFLDGISLRLHLLARRPDWAATLAVLRKAGEGLAASHAVGVVQRDFKPDNVMVTRDGRVVVTDFGLASTSAHTLESLDELPAGDATSFESRRAALVGTPAYMAPEQLRGQSADERSDQFSFAVTAVEALTGQRPWQGKTVKELRTAIETRPPAFAPWSVKGVPPDAARVRRVLERALSVDPKARFPSMRALLDALEGPSRRAQLVAVAALVALVVAAAAWWLTRPRCDEGARQAHALWNEALAADVAAAFTATGWTGARDAFTRVQAQLATRTARWQATWEAVCRDGGEPTLQQLRTECLERQRVELATTVKFLTTASTDDAMQATALVSGLPLATACTDARTLLTGVPPPKAEQAPFVVALRDRLAQARLAFQAGHFAQLRALTDELLPEVERIGYLPLKAEVELLSGKARLGANDISGAVESFRACTRSATAGRDDARAADCHIELVQAEGSLLRSFEAARTDARLAEALLQRLEPPPLDLVVALDMYEAYALQAEGRLEDALGLARRAVARVEREGPEQPLLPRALGNLGAVEAALHRFEDAERSYRRALEALERREGPEHPVVGLVLLNLVEPLAELGKLDAARETATRALRISLASRGPRHHYTALAQMNLAFVELMRDDPRAALPLFEEVVMTMDTGDLKDVALAEPLTGLGEARTRTGDVDGALLALEAALALRTTVPDGPWRLAETRWQLAQALEARSPARAKELARAALEAWRSGGDAFIARRASAEAMIARLR